VAIKMIPLGQILDLCSNDDMKNQDQNKDDIIKSEAEASQKKTLKSSKMGEIKRTIMMPQRLKHKQT
jgi:hypothetical protein